MLRGSRRASRVVSQGNFPKSPKENHNLFADNNYFPDCSWCDFVYTCDLRLFKELGKFALGSDTC